MVCERDGLGETNFAHFVYVTFPKIFLLISFSTSRKSGFKSSDEIYISAKTTKP